MRSTEIHMGVYPRVCGGAGTVGAALYRHVGLSPRVRGSRRHRLCNRDRRGSIPACAGEPVKALLQTKDIGVYPRVCGGAMTRHRPSLLSTGLSPRVRGSQVFKSVCDQITRSIPACAGEPLAVTRTCEPRWVYPRVCGGAPSRPRHTSRSKGLSPRVRGSPRNPSSPHDPGGSIPACAGEPSSGRSSRSRHGVYPRVCGGAWKALREIVTAQGLSPRVRGSRAPCRARSRSRRSIPACAGEPSNRPRLSCGTWGLSPRVRGSRLYARFHSRSLGSIPACAGEPRSGPGRLLVCWVYPRVCGGASHTSSTAGEVPGLSPRVRGSRGPDCKAEVSRRSIPACAGEPRRCSSFRALGTVYPRVCGGACTSRCLCTPTRGLSPRVRGSLGAIGSLEREPRSIPACAGEPKLGKHGARSHRVYPRVCGGAHDRPRLVI